MIDPNDVLVSETYTLRKFQGEKLIETITLTYEHGKLIRKVITNGTDECGQGLHSESCN